MVETYAVEIEIGASNKTLKAEIEKIKHLQDFTIKYAKEGHVDYVKQCLAKVDRYALNLGQSVDEKLKKDIMRLALKRGVKRQLKYAELYKDDKGLRDDCLKTAEGYKNEILDNQRKLKDLKPTIGDKIAYRLRREKASDEELQERFDREGKIYDVQIMIDYRDMTKEIEKVKKRLLENKPRGLKGWFGRLRQSEASVQEKAIPTKDISLRQMPSEIYEPSPGIMLDLSYKWAQEDSESGNVASTKVNIENIKKYSRELGTAVQDQELERILNASYKNGADVALKKANRHAQRGIFSKAKAEVDEARFYASIIKTSIPAEEADVILKTAYTKGMSKMLDKSAKMAEKGRVKSVEKYLGLSKECADYIGTDISQKRGEMLGTAYSNEIVRLFDEAKEKANDGMFDSVKRAMNTIESDADRIGRSVIVEKKNKILRTAARRGVEIELEKAEINEETGEYSLSKRYLKKAERFMKEILNYQRSVKEMPLGSRISYKLRYGSSSDDELQKKFDDEGLKYDVGTAMKLKEKIQTTKDEMLNPKRSRFGRWLNL